MFANTGNSVYLGSECVRIATSYPHANPRQGRLVFDAIFASDTFAEFGTVASGGEAFAVHFRTLRLSTTTPFHRLTIRNVRGGYRGGRARLGF